MLSGIVIYGILFINDKLFRVEQLPISSSENFMNNYWLKINEDYSWHMFSSSSFREESVVRIVSSSNCLSDGIYPSSWTPCLCNRALNRHYPSNRQPSWHGQWTDYILSWRCKKSCKEAGLQTWDEGSPSNINSGSSLGNVKSKHFQHQLRLRRWLSAGLHICGSC